MILNFILGIFISIGGFCIMYFSIPMIKMFGRWNWAERNLGGTRQAYILVGFALMVLGFMKMFGLVEFQASDSNQMMIGEKKSTESNKETK